MVFALVAHDSFAIFLKYSSLMLSSRRMDQNRAVTVKISSQIRKSR